MAAELPSVVLLLRLNGQAIISQKMGLCLLLPQRFHKTFAHKSNH